MSVEGDGQRATRPAPSRTRMGKSAIATALLAHAKRQWAEETAKQETVVAPISPSDESLIAATLSVLALNSDDLVVDLGCGDARWLVAAALSSNCRGYGCDINRDMLERARTTLAYSRTMPPMATADSDSDSAATATAGAELDVTSSSAYQAIGGSATGALVHVGGATPPSRPLRVVVEERDFVLNPPAEQLRAATVIVVYWFSEATARLGGLIKQHAHPQARLVSVFFQFKGTPWEHEVHVGKLRAYVYRVCDLSVEGTHPE